MPLCIPSTFCLYSTVTFFANSYIVNHLFCEAYLHEFFFFLCSSCMWKWNENNIAIYYARVRDYFVITAPPPLHKVILDSAATALATPSLYGIVLVFRMLYYDTNIQWNLGSQTAPFTKKLIYKQNSELKIVPVNEPLLGWQTICWFLVSLAEI